MSAARNAVVLGSTGGMGAHTIESFASDPHTQVIALAAAGTNLDFLAYQAVELEVFGVALRTGEFS
ncbi:MAG TPA: 1-deoxy-D-xylulose-5-phosphate reductoisomerase, partial [Beutenbergiaceae bacterium]|nr:1-deoxy-D-xylulose-5-phosphate reductoisomerase [Beutenbergiaceae bacterium]